MEQVRYGIIGLGNQGGMYVRKIFDGQYDNSGSTGCFHS